MTTILFYVVLVVLERCSHEHGGGTSTECIFGFYDHIFLHIVFSGPFTINGDAKTLCKC